MSRSRLVLWATLALVGLSAYFLFPSLKWYRMPADERSEREQDRDPILKKILNLGLDLRGGTHLVLELDRSKLPPETKTIDALERAIEIIRNRVEIAGFMGNHANDFPSCGIGDGLKYISSGFHLLCKYLLANIYASTHLRKFYQGNF